MMQCHCGWIPDRTTSMGERHIIHLLEELTEKVQTVSENQAHLDQDVAGIATAFATAIAELKAQIAAGATPEQLDFAAADALVATVQGEADADAPVPPVEPTA